MLPLLKSAKFNTRVARYTEILGVRLANQGAVFVCTPLGANQLREQLQLLLFSSIGDMIDDFGSGPSSGTKLLLFI